MRKTLLTLLVLLFAVPVLAGDAKGPKGRPFELWPPSNQAEPAPWVKKAPDPAVKGANWGFKGGAALSVKVDASKVLAPVTPYHFGGNVAWWNHSDWLLSEDILEKARQSGIRFWRWPGGSSSDNYHWDGDFKGHEKEESGSGDPTRMTGEWAVSSAEFIEFCRKTGSEAIVTANYAMARYFDVKRASAYAAKWVKWFNQEQKFKVRYWEIGNENYGPWEEGNKMKGKEQLTGEMYGKDFQVFAKALRKADPDLFIGAVAVDQDNGEEWTGYRWWMKGLIPQVQDTADYLILHQYFMWPFDQANNYKNPKPEEFFANLPKLGEAFNNVKASTAKYADGAEVLPVALTEFNLVNASPKETITLLNGLFTAEVLGEHIKAGYVCSNHWDWRNGLDAKLGGDHALLSTGDQDVPDGTPRPAYYAYVLYDRAFGDRMVESSSDDPKVKAYASTFEGGEVGLILVNEMDKPRTAKVEVSGLAAKGAFLGWVLTGKGVLEKQVSFNGVDGLEGGGGPFPVKDIPPYQGKFDPKKPLSLNIPAHSACGIVLY